MSIHGICFDEGQSGRCGLEGRGFESGQCDIPDEIIEQCTDDIREELLLHKFGALKLAVARAQTKIEFDEDKVIKEMLNNGEALEYFGYK